MRKNGNKIEKEKKNEILRKTKREKKKRDKIIKGDRNIKKNPTTAIQSVQGVRVFKCEFLSGARSIEVGERILSLSVL